MDANNNGHNQGAAPPVMPEEVRNFIGFDSVRGAFTTQSMSSAIEKIVERGDKIEDLIMRGKFWDFDHMNAWVRLLRKALHFGDKELETLLMNHLAGCTSVQGERIDILLRAVIGQYQTQKNTTVGGKIKNFLGLNNGESGKT